MPALRKLAKKKYDSTGQHRGNIGGGPLWLKETNIAEFDDYEVGGRDILTRIVEKSKK